MNNKYSFKQTTSVLSKSITHGCQKVNSNLLLILFKNEALIWLSDYEWMKLDWSS